MSPLLCIAGPPGAGKSTISALVSAQLSLSVLIRGDAFFRFLDQGAVLPHTLPEANEQNRVVIRASGAAAGQFARSGYQTVFDGVLGPWWLPSFFDATELDELHYVILFPTVECCVQRVAAREGNDSAEPGTRHMHDQFQPNLIETRHWLRDPGTPKDTAAEILFRYRQGLLTYCACST